MNEREEVKVTEEMKKNVIQRKERKNRDGEGGEEETIVLPK